MDVGHTTKAGTGHGAAMVGVIATDDDLFVRLTEQAPVIACHPHDRVVGFRPGVGKKGVIQPFGCDFREQLRQLNDRRMGCLEKGVVIGEILHLLAGGFDKFATAVPNIHAP